MSGSSPVLELEGIAAGYGSPQAAVLTEVHLSLAGGTICALLGPNGVGKTTLLNVALGWMKPDAGEIRVYGTPVHELSGRERGKAIALVPQAEHIAFEYSILEYVLLGRAPYLAPTQSPTPADIRIAEAALARAGIAGIAGRGILETSAGERQLVLLARALAQDPGILLMDEPSAHLDIARKRSLIELLRREADGGRSILLTAHEPEFASAVADSVALLREGKVMGAGAPREVMTSANLSELYGTRVEARELEGRSTFLW